MRRILRRAVLTLVPLGLFAAGCGGTADTRPATWSYISSAIVQPSCATANCHSKLAKRSGVVLDGTQDGWSQLVCRHFVVPSMAADSAVIALMMGQGSMRMPPDFALPDEDIKLIANWINAGAAYDGPAPTPTCGP